MTIEDPEAPDTPATGVVEQAPDPYEKRYNDLRPAYDRTAQEAAELRAFKESLTSDPEALRAFLAEQGYEVEDPEPDEPTYDDPQTERLARIEAHLTAREEREQQAEQARLEAEQIAVFEQSVKDQLADVATAAGVEKVDDRTRKWLESQALYGLPPRPDGTPDIEGAYAELQEWRKEQAAADGTTYRESKKSPAPPGPGSAGKQVPNLDDDDERRAYMKRQLQAAQ